MQKDSNNTSAFINGDTETKTPTLPIEIFCSEQGLYRLVRIEQLGKFHVLKTLKEEYAEFPTYRTLLRKEFQIGYQLDHPNICKTINWEKFDGYGDCIVMEWIDGVTLGEWLASHAKTDENNIRKILIEICSALSYMHSRQIIHCDLKPENIMITHNGSHVKIIDFGFADADNFAVLKEPAGTRRYASPELLEGRPTDCRSDIYSLGVIIGEMFGGKPNAKYRKIVARCTAQNRDERYNDADALLADIVHTDKSVGGWVAAVAVVAVIVTALILLNKNSTDTVSNTPSVLWTDTTNIARQQIEQSVDTLASSPVINAKAAHKEKQIIAEAPAPQKQTTTAAATSIPASEIPLEMPQEILDAIAANTEISSRYREKWLSGLCNNIPDSLTYEEWDRMIVADSIKCVAEFRQELDRIFANYDGYGKAHQYKYAHTIFDFGDYYRECFLSQRGSISQ